MCSSSGRVSFTPQVLSLTHAASGAPEASPHRALDALRPLRIMVTGGNGFLGKHLCALLRDSGCEAVQAPSSMELNLLERAHIRLWLKEHQPDLVFHLAARVGGIGANQRSPAVLFHDNLIMGTQLLDECHRAGVKKFVAVATVCGYPKLTPTPFSEDTLWDGYPEETNAPYGLAKKMLLVQAQAYRQQYDFRSVVLFPANLYGPGDNFDPDSSHVIPALIRKVHEAKRSASPFITLWGDGSPTREFLYVEDCAQALALAAIHYDGSAPVNLGTGRDITIRALAERICRVMSYPGDIRFDPDRPNGQPVRRLDVRRAREFFGFEAQIPMDVGLEKTVAWWLHQCSARDS